MILGSGRRWKSNKNLSYIAVFHTNFHISPFYTYSIKVKWLNNFFAQWFSFKNHLTWSYDVTSKNKEFKIRKNVANIKVMVKSLQHATETIYGSFYPEGIGKAVKCYFR